MSEHENCHVEPLEKPVDFEALASATAAYLAVAGMGCPRCAMRVRNGLLSLAEVLFATVILERGLAIAVYDPEEITTEELEMAVALAGNDGRHSYRARVIGQLPATQALSFH